MQNHPVIAAVSRRRRTVVGLMFVASAAMVVASLPDDAFARRGGGFSRSVGRRSFGGRSRGSGRSLFGSRSRSRSKGGLFGSRKRSRRGNAFQRGKSTSFGRKSTRLSDRRSQRRASQMASASRYSSSTRSARASSFQRRYRAPTYRFRSHYWGGSPWGGWGYGYRSVGMWDLFFLTTASHMFWYHHWHEPGIQRALYKDNMLEKAELQKLEARVKELEAKGVARDPKYLPEGVDKDLAYSKDYVSQNKEQFESASDAGAQADSESSTADEHSESSSGWLWALFGLFGVAAFFYVFFVRKY